MRMLTHAERRAAYAAVADRFELRHQQRTALDESPLFPSIMRAAHDGSWGQVAELLTEALVISPTEVAR